MLSINKRTTIKISWVIIKYKIQKNEKRYIYKR